MRWFLILLLALPAHAKVRHHKPRYHSIIAANKLDMFRQNQEIDSLRLPRIVDDNQLHQLINDGELVRIPENETLSIAPNVIDDRKYLRPWSRDFVVDMANSFYSVFHIPLVVDSAVRTVEQQHKLRRVNRYAAPEYGPYPSSHLAGITFDLAKRRYSYKQRRWIIDYLLDMNRIGTVVAIEEPTCYHVAVREIYNELSARILVH